MEALSGQNNGRELNQDFIDEELLPLGSLLLRESSSGGTYGTNDFDLNMDLFNLKRDLRLLQGTPTIGYRDNLLSYTSSIASHVKERGVDIGEVKDIRQFGVYIAALCDEEWKQACLSEAPQLLELSSDESKVDRLGSPGGRLSTFFLGKRHFQRASRIKLEDTLLLYDAPDLRLLSRFGDKLTTIGTIYIMCFSGKLLDGLHIASSRTQQKDIAGFAKSLEKLLREPATVSERLQNTVYQATAINRYVSAQQFQARHKKHAAELPPIIDMHAALIENVINIVNVIRHIMLQKGGRDIGRVLLGQEVSLDADEQATQAARTEEGRILRERAVSHRAAEEVRRIAQRQAEALSAQQIQLAIEELAKKNSDFEAPWSLTSKAVRRLGLGAVVEILVHDFRSFDGRLIMPGRDKAEAFSLVSQLEHLRHLAESHNHEDFDAHLTSQEQLSRSLIQRRDELFQQIKEMRNGTTAGLINQLPDVLDLSEVFVKIRNEWSGLSRAIKKGWPDGGRVAEILERRFMGLQPEPTVTESPVDTNTQSVGEQNSITQNEAQIETNEAARFQLERLQAIAKQLDTVLLPPGASLRELRAVVEPTLTPAQARMVVWERLYNLLHLRDKHGGELYRSKKGTLGKNSPPYFAVEIVVNGEVYAIAETPVEDNATYVVAEKLVPGNWVEVLEFNKTPAQSLGAEFVIHSKRGDHQYHLRRIENRLLDLMTIKPET